MKSLDHLDEICSGGQSNRVDILHNVAFDIEMQVRVHQAIDDIDIPVVGAAVDVIVAEVEDDRRIGRHNRAIVVCIASGAQGLNVSGVGSIETDAVGICRAVV